VPCEDNTGTGRSAPSRIRPLGNRSGQVARRLPAGPTFIPSPVSQTVRSILIIIADATTYMPPARKGKLLLLSVKWIHVLKGEIRAS